MAFLRWASVGIGALFLFGAQPVQAQTEHSRGLALFRSGDFSGAIAELNRVASKGCKPVALYLLGAAHSQLYDAQATIRTVSQAISCRNPALAPQFRGSSEKLLSWARQWLRGRRERMRFEYSDDDVEITDVSLLTALKQRAEAEAKEIDGLVEVVDRLVPVGAGPVQAASSSTRPECDEFGYLSEPCNSRDDPPAIALPPE